jgi:outer membrane lipoprotein-sorting protein
MRTPLAVALALVCSVAHAADPTGPEILQKVDKAMNAFKDLHFQNKLLIVQPNGAPREYAFETFQKGIDKRLVRFTSPGDVKGMGVLIENADTMYVYLPGFQKVRRMGTHIRNQTFMGSDFAFDDMSQITFSGTFDSKLTGSEGNAFVLELNAKPAFAGNMDFPKIKMWVDKTLFQITKMDFADASGKVMKTQERIDYKKYDGEHYSPTKIVVTDHRRNDHKSEMQFIDCKFDVGLADDVFSVRSLVRGQ